MFDKTFTLLISLFKNYDFDFSFSFLLKPKIKKKIMPFIFMWSRIKCLGTKLGLAQYSKHNLLVINDRRNNNTYIKVVLLKNFIIYTNFKTHYY